ncbi:uncharacterized protein LOC121994598 [Zingiber officinale]|uniref:uncharacterized protein LOC121994598 n=1 Tax=Zingiber officinale TaxID=94328 RepID=UPI001C4CF4AB|nr:uncharacterized protein LOC121994598 [Zingiber officinale]
MTRGIDGAQEVAVHSLDYEHDREFVVESISSDTEGVGHQRNSKELIAVEAARFLKKCGLYKHLLGSGQHIFMYRYYFFLMIHESTPTRPHGSSEMGEAFCIFERRQQHMKHDERKDKCFMVSIKDSAAPASNSYEQYGNGETLAALKIY